MQHTAYNITKHIKETEHDLRKRNVDAPATHGKNVPGIMTRNYG